MASPSTSRQATTTSTSSRTDRARRRRRQRPRRVREAGVSPTKALGQHFLTDRLILARIAAAAGLSPADTVVEIGAGLGDLTEALARQGAAVVAVEIDPALCAYLRARFASRENVRIVEGDALAVAPESLAFGPGTEYVLAGNLPYNAGLAILRRFLESARPPLRCIVMLQKEVAENLAAGPGRMSLAAIGVQVYARARRLFNVPARAFYPPPKVRSSVLRLERRSEALVPAGEREGFFALVRAGFEAPRKQVRNSLAQGLRAAPERVEAALREARVAPERRPATLGIDDWLRLARILTA